MKNILTGLLIFGALVSSAFSSTGTWSVYTIDTLDEKVTRAGTLTFIDSNTAKITSFYGSMSCSITHGKDTTFESPILEPDLILHCNGGSKGTIAIEKGKENKMYGLNFERPTDPIYFVKETE